MHGDVVGLGHAGLTPVEAVEALVVGVGYLADVLADLDARDDLAVFLHGHELVHAVKNGAGAAGDEPFAHAEGVYARALAQQLTDEVLIEAVRAGDGALRPAGLVEHAPRLLGEVGHVAGVEADAALGDAEGLQDLVEGAYGVGHAAAQGVVGVHEQGGVLRVGAAVGAEGVELGGEHLDPGVGHGAARGDAVYLVGEHAGRAGAAADVGGPGPEHGGVRALGAAGAELEHDPPVRGSDYAVGLCGDEALVVYREQQEGLDQLRLDGRGADDHDGLAREDGRALGHGPDVAGEFEMPQIVQEGLGEHAAAAEVVDVLL